MYFINVGTSSYYYSSNNFTLYPGAAVSLVAYNPSQNMVSYNYSFTAPLSAAAVPGPTWTSTTISTTNTAIVLASYATTNIVSVVSTTGITGGSSGFSSYL